MSGQNIVYDLCLAAEMDLLMDGNLPGCWTEGQTILILKDHQPPQLLQLLRCVYFY